MFKRISIPHALSCEEAMDRCDRVLLDLRSDFVWVDIHQNPWRVMISEATIEIFYGAMKKATEATVSLDVRKESCVVSIRSGLHSPIFGRWRLFRENLLGKLRESLSHPAGSNIDLEGECRTINHLLRTDPEELKLSRDKNARALVKAQGWMRRMHDNATAHEALALDAYVLGRQAKAVHQSCLDFEFCSNHTR